MSRGLGISSDFVDVLNVGRDGGSDIQTDQSVTVESN
jgi:hypothetical protein